MQPNNTFDSILAVNSWIYITKHLRGKEKRIVEGPKKLKDSPLSGNPIDRLLQNRLEIALNPFQDSFHMPTKIDHKRSRLSIKIHDWSITYCNLFNQLVKEKRSLSRSEIVFLTGMQGVQTLIMQGKTEFPSCDEYKNTSSLTPGEELLNAIDRKERVVSPAIRAEIVIWEIVINAQIEVLLDPDMEIIPTKTFFRIQSEYTASIHAIKLGSTKIPYSARSYIEKLSAIHYTAVSTLIDNR